MENTERTSFIAPINKRKAIITTARELMTDNDVNENELVEKLIEELTGYTLEELENMRKDSWSFAYERGDWNDLKKIKKKIGE